MPPLPRPQGFTLIEMMTGITISMIVMAGVALTFLGVTNAYHAESNITSVTEGSRVSMSFLERQLKLAGYGVDPRVAFDFDTGAGALLKDNDGLTGLGAAAGGFTTDDLAFRYRDPQFVMSGVMPSLVQITSLSAPTGCPTLPSLKDGQGLMVICQSAPQTALYLTANGAQAAGATTLLVQKHPTIYNNAATWTDLAWPTIAPGCVGSGVYVFLLNEFRVRTVALQSSGVIASRPYLVVFHGLKNAPDPATNADFDPLAPDVEDFQVAYLMNRPFYGSSFAATNSVDAPAGNASNPADYILGDVDANSVATNALPRLTDAAPAYSDNYDSVNRYNGSPANIRGVRVSVLLRSAFPEATRRKAYSTQSLENHTVAVPAADGFYRTLVTSTVHTDNLSSRSLFLPPIASLALEQSSTSSTLQDFNYCGG